MISPKVCFGEKERCEYVSEKVRLPLWPQNEEESQWKNIEKYNIQYSGLGGSMLCDYGIFYAIISEQHFIGQFAAYGQAVG